MRRSRQPKRLGDVLKKAVGPMNRGGLYETSRVSAAWRKVAGDQIAGHTAGEFLRDGELVIYVDAPVWATELQAMAEPFRAALNEETGEDLVRSIRFTVSRKAARDRRSEGGHDPRRYWEEKAEPVPLSAEELRAVEESVSPIEDAELRSAVLRATIADLEWKKGLAEQAGRGGKTPE